MKVTNKIPYYSEFAKRSGMNIFSVPVNANKSVEIAFNDTAMDAFVIENGRLVDGKAFGASDKRVYAACVAKTFAYLNHIGIDTMKVADAYNDAVHKFAIKK